MSQLLARLFGGFSILIVMAALLVSIPSYAQDDGNPNTIRINEPVEANFPTVAVEITVIKDGRAIGGLEASDFTISEANRDLAIEEIGNINTLAVVVDTPNSLIGVELEHVKGVLDRFFSDPENYQDGTTVFIVRQVNDTYFPRTFTNRADILQFIDDINNGAGSNSYERGLAAAVDSLNTFIEDNGGGGNILIVSAFSFRAEDDLRTTAVLAEAVLQEQGYTTSVIQAYTGSRQRFTDEFEAIAESGGGEFTTFIGNQSGAVITPESALDPVFEHVRGAQPAYRLTYESRDGSSGEHNVEITATVDGTGVTGAFTYNGPILSDPRVEVSSVTSPIIRSQDPASGIFSNPSQDIEVEISFPDDFERDISEVVLELDGEVLDESTVISPTNTSLVLTWDLEDFVPEADETTFSQTFTLVVKASDIYGFSGESNPITVAIQANAAPVESVAAPVEADGTTDGNAIVTQTAVALQATIAAANASALSEEDIQGTATALAGLSQADLQATGNAVAASTIAAANVSPEDLQATAQAVANLSPEDIQATVTAAEAAANAAVEDAKDDSEIPIIPIVAGIVGFVLFWGVVIVVIVRRGRGRRVSPVPMAATSGPAVGNMDGMKTQLGFGAMPPAFLDVLTGNDSGKQIQVDASSFTIGRAAGPQVNYATPSYDNVSSRHCSIIQRNNEYLIVDHGSTNGTFVNGTKLTPNIETPLRHNSTVQLGKDPLSSIQMRFTVMGGGGGGGGLGDIGKTRIDVGVGPAAPADPAVWGNKTQLYGNQQNQPPAPPPPQQQPPAGRAATPGQFFNPGQPQRPPAQPPVPPPPPQGGGQQGQRKQGGYQSDWSGGKKDNDSWLDQ